MFTKKIHCLLLCVVAMVSAQAQTVQELAGFSGKEVAEALSSPLRDSAHINHLREIANFYTGRIYDNPALIDSVMLIAAHIRRQSTPGYAEGVTQAYSVEWCAWIVLHDARASKKEPVGDALEKANTVEKAMEAYMIRENDASYIGDVYLDHADFYAGRRIPNNPERVRLDSMAILYYKKTGNKAKEAEALCAMANAYASVPNPNVPKAEESYLASIRVGTEGKWKGIYIAYSYLGHLYHRQDRSRLGLKYLLDAARMEEAAHDTSAVAALTNLLLANCYTSNNDTVNAIVYHRKALELFEKSPDSHVSDIGYSASGLARRLVDKEPQAAIELLNHYLTKYPSMRDQFGYKNFLATFIEAYGKLKQYKEGQPYCEELMRLHEIQPVMVHAASIIQFLIRSGQYRLAQERLEAYGKKVLASGEKQHIYRYYLYQSQVDTARGDYKAAFFHAAQAKITNDSIFNNRKARELDGLQLEYETEKKEQAIQLLTKEGELREQKNRQVTYATFGGIGVLIIIVSLVYAQYRNKQRANEVITSKNEKLQALVDEKQWLLKEVHHRVKNNLQTVVSLLESQSAYLRGGEAVLALQDSQNRVKAMSLIHQKLYQSENVSSLDMNRYLRELISYLADSFDVRQKIYFDLDIDAVELDVSQAIPIGLLLNEAITNSIKHGFTGRESGNVITVRMKHHDDNRVHLTVADNGTGFPPDLDIAELDQGLGLSLMKGLMTDIDGQLTIHSNGGVTVSVSFVASELLSQAVYTHV